MCWKTPKALTEKRLKLQFDLRIGFGKGCKPRRQNDLMGAVGQRDTYGALFRAAGVARIRVCTSKATSFTFGKAASNAGLATRRSSLRKNTLSIGSPGGAIVWASTRTGFRSTTRSNFRRMVRRGGRWRRARAQSCLRLRAPARVLFAPRRRPPRDQLGVPRRSWDVESAGVYDAAHIFLGFMGMGAIIAVVSCYQGFHCEPGADGVGKAATAAFVYSFVLILVVDLFLNVVLNHIYFMFYPTGASIL